MTLTNEEIEYFIDSALCMVAPTEPTGEYEFIKCFSFKYNNNLYVLRTCGYQGQYWSTVYQKCQFYYRLTLFYQEYNSKSKAVKNHKGIIQDLKSNNADYIYRYIEPFKVLN